MPNIYLSKTLTRYHKFTLTALFLALATLQLGAETPQLLQLKQEFLKKKANGKKSDFLPVVESKVDASVIEVLRNVIEEIKQSSVLDPSEKPVDIKALNLTRLSAPRIARVNNHGEIQVYIILDAIKESILSTVVRLT